VEIELLGPPGVVGDDGGRRRIAGRQRALLGRLALATPRPVPVDQLLDAVWGDELPADPANALQQRISSLRRALGTEAGGVRLRTASGAYALQVEDEAIDARRFERLAARGSRLLAEGDAAGALDDLVAALGLWKGEALEGVADEAWAQPDARRLTERRRSALEDRFDAALALGAGGDLVGELTAALDRHPLRERLAGQLMVARYRDGDQAAALEVYDRTRRLLVDELGVDPGPALREVYRQVLDQDPALAGTAPASARAGTPAPAVATVRSDNLPAARGPLLGREDELAALDGRLQGGRLVTLIGPAGTGKTSLALEVVRRRPRPAHGTWLVDLAPLTGGEAVLGELAAVVGLGAGGLGGPEVDRATLVAALRDRQLLLVLDNCEHVLAEVAALADELLATAPRCTVLATSREPLGIDGEQVWPLAPLEVPGEGDRDPVTAAATPAVRLLVERTRQHDPWFDLSPGDLPLAVDLVRRLDGVPLAIELAAAQLRVSSLQELVAGLDTELLGLSAGRRSRPERHRSLRDTLVWSWELLDDRTRRSWAALAALAGPFDRPTAEPLLRAAGVDGSLPALRDLADRSLLVVDRSPDGTRYRMLAAVRAFGHEQLEVLGLGDAVATAHANTVEAAIAACRSTTDPARFGIDLDAVAGWLDEARAALRGAAERDDRARIQRLAAALGWVWLLRGLAGEGTGWLDRGLGDLEAVDPGTAQPEALLWASGLRLGAAHPDGRRWSELAVAAVSRLDDRVLAGVFAAVHDLHVGEVAAGVERLATARALAEEVGGWPLGFCQLITAQFGRLTGRSETVARDAAAAYELLDEPGLTWGRVYALDILIDGMIEGPADDARWERARDLAREGLTLCRGRRLPELEGRLRLQLARALHELGEVDAARRYADEAVELAAAPGPGVVGLGFACLGAGSLARRRGDLEAAAASLERARELLATSGSAYGAVQVHVELALTAAAQRRHAAAASHARTARGLAERSGEPNLRACAEEVASLADGVVTGP
jgi:predicted ATPase/DNA-binding SARP family transcriptional activator